MKIIASLAAEVAIELAKKLKAEAIPYKIQAVTQEGGLEYNEISVDDANYERACAVAEAWAAQYAVDEEAHSNRHCPTCGSKHWESMGAATFGGTLWKCKDCGNAFAR